MGNQPQVEATVPMKSIRVLVNGVWRSRAEVTCQCGAVFVVHQDGCTCDCGRMYNLYGHLLMPQAQTYPNAEWSDGD